MKSLYHYKARYVSAYDVDTIRLDLDLGFGTWLMNQSIRLYGINGPEMRGASRPEGIIARDYVRDRLENAKEIRVRTFKDDKEKYGRWLAIVIVDGRILNNELVKKGYAIPYMIE